MDNFIQNQSKIWIHGYTRAYRIAYQGQGQKTVVVTSNPEGVA